MPPKTRRSSALGPGPDHVANAMVDPGSSSPSSSAARHRSTSKKGNRFEARPSMLDYETLISTKNQFRGFLTLFWVTMAVGVLSAMYKNVVSHGQPVSLRLALHMISDTSLDFLLVEAAMIASMFFVVPLQIIISRGWLNKTTSLIIQHLFQTIWFLGFLGFLLYKNLNWAQSGVFTMHLISMLFKIHSYNAYNIELSFKNFEYRRLLTGSKNDDDKDSSSAHDQELIALLKHELVKTSVTFPENQTFGNFFDYILVPTLVYELEYPRTDRFRLWYFMERCFTGVVTIGLMYFIVEHWVTPIIHELPDLGTVHSMLSLLMPFMLLWLIGFFVIFECICNAFAEITMFADRHFYSDWWNSSSYDEFARNWNKPVHEFLLRHVYQESIDTYKLSKNNATFITFLFSSLLHELVMAVIGKRIRPWFFLLQMTQIPLIHIQRLPIVRRHKLVGNIFFWVGMFLGLPLLCVAYVREKSPPS